jgi:hypothetical protein
MIQDELNKLSTAPVEEWKKGIVAKAYENGIINDKEKWTTEANEPMPSWAVLAIANNIKEQIDKLQGGK